MRFVDDGLVRGRVGVVEGPRQRRGQAAVGGRGDRLAALDQLDDLVSLPAQVPAGTEGVVPAALRAGKDRRGLVFVEQ